MIKNNGKKILIAIMALIPPLLATAACKAEPEELIAKLTPAPNVPRPITRKSPARVKIKLTTEEKVMRMADGVEYMFWTFGGTVPGPFMRVRAGDIVDFELSNLPGSKMPHNIDLHAVTGPGGGAASSLTAPGHTSKFSFKVINPGLYVYHCATAPVGMHVANGMYGLILVEPEEGLPQVDREFYVFQSEFYTRGKYGAPGLQPFDMDKAVREQPTYVVFNGSVGAMAGTNAITAKTGEKVRMFIGNGGPNLVSSFHVIGEIFDNVYTEGGSKINQHNVQTTLVPAGGSSIVDFKLEVPGTYVLVDHSIFRAFNKGALGLLKVEGESPDSKQIYSGKIADEVYHPEGAVKGIDAPDAKANLNENLSKAERIEAGQKVFMQSCAACHQSEGQGVKGAFPPLAKSDYLMADKNRAIKIVANGLSGAIVVNGEKYDGVMPGLGLNEHDIANVLTFVRNSFGNSGDMVTPAEVRAQK